MFQKENDVVPILVDSATPMKTPKPLKYGNLRSKANGNKSETSSTMSVAALKRETQRKQLLEMKRKKRLEMAANLSPNGNQRSLLVENKNSIETNIVERNSQIEI